MSPVLWAKMFSLLLVVNNRDVILRSDEDERTDGVGITDTIGRNQEVK